LVTRRCVSASGARLTNQVIIGIVVLRAAVAVLVFAANSRKTLARESERQMGTAMALKQGTLRNRTSSRSFRPVGEQLGEGEFQGRMRITEA
jgi:hypothetical protein